MILQLLFVAGAFAGERPVAPDDRDSCPPVGLSLGLSFTPRCEMVAISRERAVFMKELAIWADAERDLRILESVSCAADADVAAERAEWWRMQAEGKRGELSTEAVFGIGVGTGVAVTILLVIVDAWALGQAQALAAPEG